MADTSLVQSYSTVGRKEQVADAIYDISPTATPFQTMIGREKIKSRIVEWQEDSLDAVTNVSEVEGFDPSSFDYTPTVMRSNNTQIFSRTVKVSGSLDAIEHYGRGKESSYQLVKKAKEAKRNLEHTLIGVDQEKVAGDSSTARKLASAYKMIDDDVTVTADGGAGDPDALQYSHLKDVLKKLYDAGAIDGDRMTFMVKPADADVVASWGVSAFTSDGTRTGVSSRELGNGRELVDVIDLIRTPWGFVRVILNRWIKSEEALVFDPSNWKMCWLRPWQREELAKTGDARRWLLVGEGTLKHTNFKASGRISNLT